MGHAVIEQNCKFCNKTFFPQLRKVKIGNGKFCSRSCVSSYTNSLRIGEKNPMWNRKLIGKENGNWKGGLIQSSKGYWYIYQPDHPRAKRGYVKRADLVLEKKLGRPLKSNEIAHHGPGGKEDDSPKNLTAMTITEHKRYHAKMAD
jgi:hypothetical protein